MVSAPLVAQDEKFPLEFRAIDSGGAYFPSMGKQLKHDDSLRDRLSGIPEAASDQAFFMEAELGTGTGNRFAMVFFIHYDEAFWIMDTNRNGDLSDEKDYKAVNVRNNWHFPAIDLKIPMNDHDAPYRVHMVVTRFRSGKIVDFTLSPAGYRRGQIVIDGETLEVKIRDYYTNGKFNDRWDNLIITKDQKMCPRFKWGESEHGIIHRGKCYLLEVNEEGSFIYLRRTIDEMATLTTNFKRYSLILSSEELGRIYMDAVDGKIHLPAGDYLLINYSIYPTEYGAEYSLNGDFDPGEPLKLPAGDIGIDICQPIRQYITCRTRGDSVTIEQELRGRLGEEVDSFGGALGNSPALRIMDNSGNILGVCVLNSLSSHIWQIPDGFDRSQRLNIKLIYPYNFMDVPEEQLCTEFQIARDSIPRPRVIRVYEDSLAATHGIRRGDIILKYGDTDITSIEELEAASIDGTGAVDLLLKRDGEELTLTIPRGSIGIVTTIAYE